MTPIRFVKFAVLCIYVLVASVVSIPTASSAELAKSNVLETSHWTVVRGRHLSEPNKKLSNSIGQLLFAGPNLPAFGTGCSGEGSPGVLDFRRSGSRCHGSKALSPSATTTLPTATTAAVTSATAAAASTPTTTTTSSTTPTQHGQTATSSSTPIIPSTSASTEDPQLSSVSFPPPVQFSQLTVQASAKVVFQPGLVTCVAVWGDAWYVGTLEGIVYKIIVDASNTVTSVCSSAALTDNRYLSPSGTPAQADILGITFDPSDTSGRPYVTVQTLFWNSQNRIASSNLAAWRNGRIVRLRPNGLSSGQCLIFDSLVVDGLPVSDDNHGNNGMTFDQNGNILLSVGSFTNQGLPGKALGDKWDTPLSAAIVKVNLGKGAAFNGKITYSKDLPNILNTTQLSGDVSVYAAGLRNSYDICFTSGMQLFATDNGPNVGLGNVATSCLDRTNDSRAIRTDSTGDITGVAGIESYFRNDKVLRIVESSFYGSPNLNRGQCDYIDPTTNKDALGNAPPANYVAPLQILPSSVDGVIEYTANVFGNNLKGQLIVTSLEGGQGTAMTSTVYTVTTGGVSSVLDPTWGGLSVAQGTWGELIFPRINANDIHVLQPSYKFPRTLTALVVTPFRGGAAGGLRITITGHNFGKLPSVTIDGHACTVVSGSVVETSLGRKLSCITPRANPGRQLVDVVVESGSASSTIPNGFMYSLV